MGDAVTYLELLASEAPPVAFREPVADAKAGGIDGSDLERLIRAERLAYDVCGLFEHRRRRAASLSALLDTARDLLGADDVATVLGIVTRRARTLLNLDMAYVALHDPELGADVVRAVDGHVSGLTPSFRVPGDGGLGVAAQRWIAPFSTPDYLADPGIQHSPEIDEVVRIEGLRAVVAVPLSAPDGSHLGVLYAAAREVRHFETEEIALMGELGQLVSPAVAASLDRQRMRDKAERLASDVRRAEEEREGVWRLRDSQHALMELILSGASVDRFLTVAGQLLDAEVSFEEGNGGTPPDGKQDTGAEVVGGRWVCAVRGAVDYGRLTVGRAQPLSDVDTALLRSCAQALAVLLQSRATGISQQDDFLEVLLAAQPGTKQLAEQRARSLGFDLRSRHVLVAARPEGGLSDRIRTWASVYAREAGGLRSYRADHVVLLLPGEDPSALARAVADSCAAATGQLVTAGAAGPGTEPEAAPGLYKQAARCLHAVTVLGVAGGVASPRDLGFLELLLADEHDMEGFIGAVIGPLLEYDERRSADLAPTLEAYYAANGSPTRAGEQLFVHANTVARRLERVTDLLGPRWQDGVGALEVQLALRMHRVRARLRATDGNRQE
ncbi:helix-turn-helix domain-containing protein [Streptomyces purpurogeneiscleroticus]|uniref:helix-turn-helix domain-containing protein n=1 Tax=Streptomyces purpurogeneiscleroticus TaxID=68259 RepID=UPI001CBA76D8|nr:helix-turn-helix domain-containing protein [Streptomyces purpurogeneiscleroticus]